MRISQIAKDAIDMFLETLERNDVDLMLDDEDFERARDAAVAEIIDGTDEEQRQLDAFPDLLAACEFMLKAYRYIPIPEHEDKAYVPLWDAREKLQTAITKAKGEQL